MRKAFEGGALTIASVRGEYIRSQPYAGPSPRDGIGAAGPLIPAGVRIFGGVGAGFSSWAALDRVVPRATRMGGNGRGPVPSPAQPGDRALPVSERAQAALARARSATRSTIDINPILVEQFGQTTREKLTTGDVPFRKAYLGASIDRIEVDDHVVRIVGRKDVLAGSHGERWHHSTGSHFCTQMALSTIVELVFSD